MVTIIKINKRTKLIMIKSEKNQDKNIHKIKIEKLIYGGFGFGKTTDDKIAFVKNAYPGEIVNGNLIKERKDYSLYSLNKVIQKNENRITPVCPHFGVCGGCDWLDYKYESQLIWKKKILKEQLQRIGKIDCEIEKDIYDKNYFYRNRMEFVSLLKEHTINFGMYKKSSKEKLSIDRCYLCSEKVIEAKSKIENELNSSNFSVNEKRKISNLVIRENDEKELFIIFILKSNSSSLIKLIESIKNKYKDFIFVIVINKNKKIILSGKVVYRSSNKKFYHRVDKYKYQIHPLSFFQNNRFLLKNLISEIYNLVDTDNDLLELYCGNGFFTIPLSGKFQKVTAVENSPKSIKSLKENLKINKINNVIPIREDSHDYLINSSKRFEAIFIDPPRIGCGSLMDIIIEKAGKHIYYLSCNPSALAKDLKLMISKGFFIEKIFLIDLFPNTYHIESFVKLSRKERSITK